MALHDEVMTWKYLLYYWPFVKGIYWLLVASPHTKPEIWSFDVFLLIQAVETMVELIVIWDTLKGDLRCHDAYVKSLYCCMFTTSAALSDDDDTMTIHLSE